MSEWEAEINKLRGPLFDAAWDFVLYPVHWNPGDEWSGFTPQSVGEKPDFTGKRSAPAIWLDHMAFVDQTIPLNAAEDQVVGSLEIGILWEPIVDDRTARLVMDLLTSAYKAGSVTGLEFRVYEARPQPFGPDGQWERVDWVCPYWRFTTT